MVPWLVFRSAEHAGRVTADAIEANQLYAITHPLVWPRVAARNAAVQTAFADAADREPLAAQE